MKMTIGNWFRKTIYAISNHKNEWFCGGWTHDAGKMRLYHDLSTARKIVSRLFLLHPELPCPDIIALPIEEAVILEEEERVKAMKKRIDAYNAAAEEKRKKLEIEVAEKRFQEAKDALEKLTK